MCFINNMMTELLIIITNELNNLYILKISLNNLGIRELLQFCAASLQIFTGNFVTYLS